MNNQINNRANAANAANAAQRNALMKKIQINSFAALETALYLDTHPSDITALEYYQQKKAELEQFVDEFEAKFGSLTHSGNNGSEWNWVDGPWPWEGDEN